MQAYGFVRISKLLRHLIEFRLRSASILLTLACPILVQAQELCADVFSPKISISGDRSEGQLLSTLAREVIEDIDSMRGKLLMPDEINLELSELEAASHFNYPSNSIRIYDLTVGTQLLNRRAFFPVFSHEAGHQLLFVNLWKAATAKYGERIDAFFLKFLQLGDPQAGTDQNALMRTWSQRKMAQLQAEENKKPPEQRRAEYKLREEVKEASSAGILFSFSRRKEGAAYDELFADVVAALQSNSGTAVADRYRSVLPLLQPHERAETIANGNALDFTFDNKVEGWTLSEVHFLYGPTRSLIGAKYLKSAVHTKTQVLEGVFDAIVSEVVERYLDPKLNEQLVSSPEIANRRLMAAIVSRLP